MPHVAAWWGDASRQLSLVLEDLDEPAMAQFLVETEDRPFAYLQCYDLSVWADPGLSPQPAATRAIDQFIGEPDMIDKGHGSAFIRAFTDDLLASRVPRVLTDPDPANARAIRVCEKAGFIRDRVVETHDGPALLMVRDK